MNTDSPPQLLVGLGFLARLAFEGADLEPVAAQMQRRLESDPSDAAALLDLATILQLQGARERGLDLLERALRLCPSFEQPAARSPVAGRLVVFKCVGDLAQNNTVEFLLEKSDIALHVVYVDPALPLPDSVPDHDAAMVAICETDFTRPLLQALQSLTEGWPRPVLNAPARIAETCRDRASVLLQGVEGLFTPLTVRAERKQLHELAERRLDCADLFADAAWPLVVRPVDSQMGRGQARCERPDDLVAYLEAQPEATFYVTRYIDYRSPDGQFRKYRIVLVDGRPYPCHMAISSTWKVHYVTAGMYDDPVKRAEEARCFETFDDDFARRHEAAMRGIHERLGLEYVGFDCGETPDGRMLMFEVDAGLTVHDFDPPALFPYKPPTMRRVFEAFRSLILERGPSLAR